jgi:predicted peptidase
MAQTADSIPFEPGKQLPQQFSVTVPSDSGDKETTVYYLLFTPNDYKPDGKPWPLLLFLHGYGESGDNELDRLKIHGPPQLVDSRPEFPFIVVTPQCPPLPREMAKIRGAWQSEQLIQLLDHVSKELNVDPSRVYVTGLSMGGFGTWRLAAAHPDRFAAAVPICGGGEPNEMAKALKGVPIWAFHGAQDTIVPLAQSEDMVNAVRAAGGDVRLTVYPDVGHASWKRAYASQELYDWLLSHPRQQK